MAGGHGESAPVMKWWMVGWLDGWMVGLVDWWIGGWPNLGLAGMRAGLFFDILGYLRTATVPSPLPSWCSALQRRFVKRPMKMKKLNQIKPN